MPVPHPNSITFGPVSYTHLAECCRVVALVLERIVRQAQASGLKVEMIEREVGPVNRALLSATIALQGTASGELADEWEGTVQWIAQSPYRIYHKRKNWFVGVHSFVLSESQEATERDFRYETLRASGPGGQHVNKTESAVRAVQDVYKRQTLRNGNIWATAANHVTSSIWLPEVSVTVTFSIVTHR